VKLEKLLLIKIFYVNLMPEYIRWW